MIPVFDGRAFDVTAATQSDIVDQHIDPSKMFDGDIDQLAAILLDRDIGSMEDRLPSIFVDACGNRLADIHAAVGDYDFSALPGEEARDSLAHAFA